MPQSTRWDEHIARLQAEGQTCDVCDRTKPGQVESVECSYEDGTPTTLRMCAACRMRANV